MSMNELSEKEYERRSRVILFIEDSQREKRNLTRRLWKSLTTWRGPWRNKVLYDEKPNKLPLKAALYLTQDLAKPLMKVKYPGFVYYKNEELKNKLYQDSDMIDLDFPPNIFEDEKPASPPTSINKPRLKESKEENVHMSDINTNLQESSIYTSKLTL